MAAAFQNPTMVLTRSFQDYDLEVREKFQEGITQSAPQELGDEKPDSQILNRKELLAENLSRIDGFSLELDNITNHLKENKSYNNVNIYQMLDIPKLDYDVEQSYEIIRTENKSLINQMEKSKSLQTGIILTPIFLISGLLLITMGFNFGIGISVLSLSSFGFSLISYWLLTGIETINPRILVAFTYSTLLSALLNFIKNII